MTRPMPKLCLMLQRAHYKKVFQGFITIKSAINTDGWLGYHGLVNAEYEKEMPTEIAKEQALAETAAGGLLAELKNSKL